jgi:hypothetical protein
MKLCNETQKIYQISVNKVHNIPQISYVLKQDEGRGNKTPILISFFLLNSQTTANITNLQTR